MPATIGFFNNDVPLAFAKVADGPDKQAFAKANANLVAAIQDYAQWLKNDLMPKASGDYAIGADAYRRMLNDADMVDMPLDQLEQVGRQGAGAAARRIPEDGRADRSETLAGGCDGLAHAASIPTRRT